VVRDAMALLPMEAVNSNGSTLLQRKHERKVAPGRKRGDVGVDIRSEGWVERDQVKTGCNDRGELARSEKIRSTNELQGTHCYCLFMPRNINRLESSERTQPTEKRHPHDCAGLIRALRSILCGGLSHKL
jgi:hypothetical protein